jgi:hypothetical protein
LAIENKIKARKKCLFIVRQSCFSISHLPKPSPKMMVGLFDSKLSQSDNGGFTYSDKDGSFQLSAFHSLIIRHINCYEQTFNEQDILNRATIYLVAKTIDSNEVVVLSNEKTDKAYSIGNLKKKSNYTINIDEKMQVVLFIPREEYPEGTRLISLEIPVFSRFQKTNNRLLIRLKIYTHHPESLLPNEELGKINEVFEIEDTHLNTYSIDLEKYRIILPQNGFYIGFELMGTIDKDSQLIRNQSMPSGVDL